MAKFSGIRLQILRKEKGLTQKELAERLGVSVSSIIKYEGGERQPEPAVLEKILDMFEVSLDYLFGRSGEQNAEKLLIEQNYPEAIDYIERAAENDSQKLFEKTPFYPLKQALQRMDIDSRKQAINVLNTFLHLLSKNAAISHEGKLQKEIFDTYLNIIKEVSWLNGFYFSSDGVIEEEPDLFQSLQAQRQVRKNVVDLLDDLLEQHLKRLKE